MSRPELHFTPVHNWMNDPNGFIYYNGEYHLFYQYFPYDIKWGTMHWGHKTSKNLIHWKDEGVALYPSKDFDRNGCFSGSAIEVDGKMYIYYTAIIYSKLNPQNIHVSGDGLIASQAMIISEDGYTFDPDTKKVIIPTFSKDDLLGHISNTRDPKVWKETDQYYMVVGSQYEASEKMHGEVLIYISKDAIDWHYSNRLIDESIDSNMWECPDMFEVDGQRILIMSPENIVNDGENYPSHATWSIVNFNNETCEASIVQKPQFLDYGLDLYAPQTTIDKDGNRIVIAWLRMPKCGEDGDWIGLYTFPRVLYMKDNHLCFKVHPNVDKLFKHKVKDFSLSPRKISCTMNLDSYLNIGGFEITFKDNCICTNREKVFTQAAKLFNDESQVGKRFKTPRINGECHIDIYVDKQVIEIYVNDGKYVLSNIVYDLKEELNYQNINDLKLYAIK